MKILASLVLRNFRFSFVTVSRGLVPNMNFPNSYCTSCLHLLFRVSDCERRRTSGDIGLPEGALDPELDKFTCLTLALAGAHGWPCTPKEPAIIVEYGVVQLMRTMQLTCVRTAIVWSVGGVISSMRFSHPDTSQRARHEQELDYRDTGRDFSAARRFANDSPELAPSVVS